MEKVLRVAEARAKDAGRGTARIDPALTEALRLEVGSVIEVEGKRKTVALLAPGLPEDRNRGTIRIDGNVRRNAGVGIDEKVGVRAVSARPAERAVLAPTEPLKIMGGDEYLGQLLEGRPIVRGDSLELAVMGRRFDLVVVSFQPAGEAAVIERTTRIEISEKPAKEVQPIARVSYEDLGGLGEEVRKVREMIELPLRHPELFERLGVEAPKGVLLHGPPGTGKTLLARAVASETAANFVPLSGPEVMSKFYGQSEENLREIFKGAEENAPSIIFIDEIDSIAPKRDEVSGEVERRVVAQLLSLMDGLAARGKVVVIGATNRVNALDPALRRPGRFDREIEIGIPDRDGRLQILQIHTRGMPLAKDVPLEGLAGMTHGYVGADLAALCKEAALRSLRRVIPDIDLEAAVISMEVLAKLIVTREDFESAFREMGPSTLREVLLERPNVRWADIGGMAVAKQALQEAVEWPLKHGAVFRAAGARPPKGVLLHGPPGTGKTMLAKAVATESEANFISVKGPEFLSKWVGESERAVRETFRKARQAAPCVIFFDEIDAIAPVRGMSADAQVSERVISQLLTEMDGLEELHGVTLVAATNRLDIVDPALLRPGRFDRLIEVGLPDQATRRAILGIHTKGKPLAKGIDLDALAKDTDGLTGADLAAVCNEASMLTVRDRIAAGEARPGEVRIPREHFAEALRQVRARGKPAKPQPSSQYA
jgi:transitional endoplasmic reticulum ATPase